jgi:hypothetical protein
MKAKTKEKRKRKPGGGRRSLIQGVELVTAVIKITQAQKDHLQSRGDNGNISDGARKIITHDMALGGEQ